MHKIKEFCILFIISIIAIVGPIRVFISIRDAIFLLQLACDMLRIIFCICGLILVYNSLQIKHRMNNGFKIDKISYLGITLISIFLLFTSKIKVYLFSMNTMDSSNYEIQKLMMDWIQLGIITIGIKYISKDANLKRWIVGEILFIIILQFIIRLDTPILQSNLLKANIQLWGRIFTSAGVIVLFITYYNKINQMEGIHRKLFIHLFELGIGKAILGVGVILFDSMICQILQYVLYLAFFIWIASYMDQVSLGSMWKRVEMNVEDKKKNIQLGQKEQTVLMVAIKEIKYTIQQIMDKIGKLDEQLEQYNKGKKYLEKIRNNNKRLLRLSNDILEVNKHELGKRKPKFQHINLNEWIDEIIKSMETYISQCNIELEYITAKKIIYADVEPDAIERILFNLISNAVKYNKEDGKIKVILAERKNQVYLCVQDSGIGIPSNSLKIIFDKFKRVESKQTYQKEGSGLGLAIVKSLVEMHQGEIKIASGEGEGTIISITLPLVQDINQSLKEERTKTVQISS